MCHPKPATSDGIMDKSPLLSLSSIYQFAHEAHFLECNFDVIDLFSIEIIPRDSG
jgi:hypothetical protein